MIDRRSGALALFLALSAGVGAQTGGPYPCATAECFPRTQDQWNNDPQIVHDAVGTNLRTDAFDAFTVTNTPALIDSSYVKSSSEGFYPAIISVNNNFGATRGDTLVLGNFSHQGQFLLSIHARPVEFEPFFNRDQYLQYVWIEEFSNHGSGFRVDARKANDHPDTWLQVFDESQWPEPLPYSTNEEGKVGFFQE